MEAIHHSSKIVVDVHLNEKKIPVKMAWKASDNTQQPPQDCKALMMSLWDPGQKAAMRIDLWNEDMSIEEMNHFLFQTFHTMADTVMRATGNEAEQKLIHDFALEFGKRNGVLAAK